jgi:hypothetical protein
MKNKVVWFHRSRAVLWGVIGIASFAFGFASNVMVVWIASLYANIVSDWTAGEAADDRTVLNAIEELKTIINQHIERCVCNVGDAGCGNDSDTGTGEGGSPGGAGQLLGPPLPDL